VLDLGAALIYCAELVDRPTRPSGAFPAVMIPV
jgi:hypothetical protein